MIGLKEASLTVLAFELVQDAEKTPEKNQKKAEDFKKRCEGWQQKATAAGLTCNCEIFAFHDSLIATPLISKDPFKDLGELTLPGKEILEFTENTGQTVVLFAQPEGDADLKKLAQDCYRELGLEKPEDAYLRPGKLFGSDIFEYQNRRHFWFWFDTNPLTRNQMQEKFYEISKLLLHRSKVIYAYKQAKTASQRADELHLQLIGVCRQVQEAVKDKVGTSLEQRQQELETLKERLKEVSRIGFAISEEIRFLRYAQNSIRVNSGNYFFFCQELGSPPFFEEFYHQSQRQLLEQVTSDLNYITPSYDLANQTIATIRGYMNIEQARCEQENQSLEEKRDEEKEKRDRKLQDTIEAISIALGAVAIIASFAGMLEKPICIPLGQKCSWLPHPFLLWVVSSMFLAWLFYQLVLWFKTGGWQSPREKR